MAESPAWHGVFTISKVEFVDAPASKTLLDFASTPNSLCTLLFDTLQGSLDFLLMFPFISLP